MSLLFSIALAYCIGAFPAQWFLTHVQYGTKGNHRAYWITIEMIKGLLATLIALFIGQWFAASLAAIFVVLGSMYSIFNGFKGESGVFVATGGLLVLSPILFLVGVSTFMVCLLITRYFDLSTLITTVIVMIIAIFFVHHSYVWIGTISLGVLLLFDHQIDWNQLKIRGKALFRFKK